MEGGGQWFVVQAFISEDAFTTLSCLVFLPIFGLFVSIGRLLRLLSLPLLSLVNKFTLVVDFRPLRLSVWHIHHPARIEHVARRIEVLPIRLVLPINERREKQDHVSTLVHDWGPAVGAADFAGKLVNAGLFGRLVPAEVVVAVGEVDVFLVEDGAPLEGGA